MTNDRRTNEQRESTQFFVNATDRFMSGWGQARGGLSYFCIACDTDAQVDLAETWLRSRDEMKSVFVSSTPRKRKDCHTSIVHFEKTGAAQA